MKRAVRIAALKRKKEKTQTSVWPTIRFKRPNVAFRDRRAEEVSVYTYVRTSCITTTIRDYYIPGRGRVKLFMGDGSAARRRRRSLVFVAVV